MVARCRTEKRHAFADYGGRGIRVYERWLPDGTGQGVPKFLPILACAPSQRRLTGLIRRGITSR